MSEGRETAVLISDWSQYIQDSHSFVGNLKFCRRPQGGDPSWLMFVSDTGEVRVYDYLGVHHPEDDIALGFNPDDAYINNEDPPKIAVKQATAIRVYEEGAQLLNTGAIANLQYINISNGFLHCTVGGNVGFQWRSLVDGGVLHTVSLVNMSGNVVGQVVPTEAGTVAFTQYRDSTGSLIGWTVKADTDEILWKYQFFRTGGSMRYLRAAGDGSIIISSEWAGGWGRVIVLNEFGVIINVYDPSAAVNYAVAAQPDGVCAAWALMASTTARIVRMNGTVVNIVLPANIVSRQDAVEVVLGGYVLFECVDGNIYVYDLAGALQATIVYTLATSPLAALIR